MVGPWTAALHISISIPELATEKSLMFLYINRPCTIQMVRSQGRFIRKNRGFQGFLPEGTSARHFCKYLVYRILRNFLASSSFTRICADVSQH